MRIDNKLISFLFACPSHLFFFEHLRPVSMSYLLTFTQYGNARRQTQNPIQSSSNCSPLAVVHDISIEIVWCTLIGTISCGLISRLFSLLTPTMESVTSIVKFEYRKPKHVIVLCVFSQSISESYRRCGTASIWARISRLRTDFAHFRNVDSNASWFPYSTAASPLAFETQHTYIGTAVRGDTNHQRWCGGKSNGNGSRRHRTG